MAKITLKGNEVRTIGQLPQPGEKIASFTLVKNDLSEVNGNAYSGQKKILNIFPSIDTDVCSATVKNFHDKITAYPKVVLLCISKDLPFAQQRFCQKESIDNGELLSAFRSSFAKDYGLEIVDGPLKGLCSRVVLVIDESDRVLYTEQVQEVTDEPDYDEALKHLS